MNREEKEAGLEEKSDFFSEVFNTVREPLLILNDRLELVSANESFYRTFRVSPEESENRLIYELGEGQWNIPRLRELLGEILPRQMCLKDFDIEHDFPSIGKRVMRLSARKICRKENAEERILLAIEDVTARHEAAEALRSSEERFRAMFESMKEYAVLSLDNGGFINGWIAGSKDVLGYSEDEMVGQHLSAIFTPEDIRAGVPQKELEDARTKGRSYNEREQVRKDGSRFWSSGYLKPLHNRRGEPAGFIKIFQDKTDSKLISDALEKSNRELERFANAASHDLQEPLRSIQSLAELAADELESHPDEELKETMKRLCDHAARAQKLVKEQLEYAKAIEKSLRKKKADFNSLHDRVLEILKIPIEENKALISRGPLPFVKANSFQMVQVMQNLISNALKYRREARPEISVSAERKEDEWIFCFKDNGIGISPADTKKIFALYSRGEKRKGFPGTGIGLSVCKEVIERHGGRIWVESEPGKGSSFYFTLPAD